MVEDAWRFVLCFRPTIEKAPLQIYCSALLFAPEQSVIRCTFKKELPRSIHLMSSIAKRWSPCLQIFETPTTSEGGMRDAALSPDGGLIASVSTKSTIHLRDAATGILLQTIHSIVSDFLTVAFSLDGTQLVSASGNGLLQTWDAVSGSMLHMQYLADVSGYMALSPNGRLVASSRSGVLRIWDVTTETLLNALETDTGHFNNVVVFSHDGSLLASNHRDGSLQIWDVSTGTLLCRLESETNRLTSVAFSPDKLHLASGSSDGGVRISKMATGALLKVLKAHTDEISALAFSKDGSLLASGSMDGTLRIWDVTTRVLLRGFEGHTEEPISFVIFTLDRSQLITGSWDQTIRIWDLSAGTSY